MKTTTYLFSGGKTTVTVSDKPALTRAEYAKACRVLNMAAMDKKSRQDAVAILREAATKQQLYSATWNMLVHAAQTVEGSR
jgi:hypothetical protein